MPGAVSEEITKAETTLRETGASQLGIWSMLWEGKSRQTDTLATKNVHGDLCRRQTHPLIHGKTHTPFSSLLNSFPTDCLCYWPLRWADIFPWALCQVSEEVNILPMPWKPQGQIQISEWDLHLFLSTPRGKQDDIERQQRQTRHNPKSHIIIKPQDRARSYGSVWFYTLHNA